LRGDTDVRIRNTEEGKRHGKYKEDSSRWKIDVFLTGGSKVPLKKLYLEVLKHEGSSPKCDPLSLIFVILFYLFIYFVILNLTDSVFLVFLCS